MRHDLVTLFPGADIKIINKKIKKCTIDENDHVEQDQV